jgi:hypothetical protein
MKIFTPETCYNFLQPLTTAYNRRPAPGIVPCHLNPQPCSFVVFVGVRFSKAYNPYKNYKPTKKPGFSKKLAF